MAEPAGGLRLAAKAHPQLGVELGVGLVDAQHLDRHRALDQRVVALVDDAHRAAPELAPDQVFAEAFRGRAWRRSVRPADTSPSIGAQPFLPAARWSAGAGGAPPASAFAGSDGVVQSTDSGAPDISSAIG